MIIQYNIKTLSTWIFDNVLIFYAEQFFTLISHCIRRPYIVDHCNNYFLYSQLKCVYEYVLTLLRAGRTESLAVTGNRSRGRKNLRSNPTRWRAWTRKMVHLGKGKFRNVSHKDLRNRTSAVRRGENRMSTYYRCNGNVYI